MFSCAKRITGKDPTGPRWNCVWVETLNLNQIDQAYSVFVKPVEVKSLTKKSYIIYCTRIKKF